MNFNMKLRRKSIIDVKNRASFKNNGAQISTAIKAISFVKENEQIDYSYQKIAQQFKTQDSNINSTQNTKI